MPLALVTNANDLVPVIILFLLVVALIALMIHDHEQGRRR